MYGYICACESICTCVFIGKHGQKFGRGKDATFLLRNLFGDVPETAHGELPLQISKVRLRGGNALRYLARMLRV